MSEELAAWKSRGNFPRPFIHARFELGIDFPGQQQAVAHGPAIFHGRLEHPYLRAAQHEHVRHALRRRDHSHAFDGAGLRNDHFHRVRPRRPGADCRSRQFLIRLRRDHIAILRGINSVVDNGCGSLGGRRRGGRCLRGRHWCGGAETLGLRRRGRRSRNCCGWALNAISCDLWTTRSARARRPRRVHDYPGIRRLGRRRGGCCGVG